MDAGESKLEPWLILVSFCLRKASLQTYSDIMHFCFILIKKRPIEYYQEDRPRLTVVFLVISARISSKAHTI